jgi:hypothetical protein
MTTQAERIEALKLKLAALQAKQKRTGGSRALTWEIDSVKWQIKCLKEGATK